MSIRIDRASKKVSARIKNIDNLTVAGIEHASFVSGKQLIRATSDEILKKPKGGRTTVRRSANGRRRSHTASAPGETHANMSGRLRRSLSFSARTRTLEFGYGVTKGDAPKYAGWVENGTNRMAARPSLRNGINSQRRNIMKNLEREIGKRLGDFVQ